MLTDSKIYFASHFNSKIGALEPRIMELQGNENLLGVLSSQGTLYIFEREGNT